MRKQSLHKIIQKITKQNHSLLNILLFGGIEGFFRVLRTFGLYWLLCSNCSQLAILSIEEILQRKEQREHLNICNLERVTSEQQLQVDHGFTT